MKPWFAVCALLTIASAGAPADDGQRCVDSVRQYVAAQFTGATNTASFLATQVTLLAGHEVLKTEYGVSDSGRGKSMTVARDRLLAGWKKMVEAMDPEKKQEAAAYLADLAYRAFTSDGTATFLPSDDPAYSKMGRLGLQTSPGDIIVFGRAGSSSDDFVLFVFRRIDNSLTIVAEYVD